MSNSKNLSDESRLISQKNLAYYDQNALSFYEGTKNHDVSQNINALLRAIDPGTSFHILDFGCGPGRDLLTFKNLGHVAVGLEGSPQFAQLARMNSGCEIWVQDFLDLDLPANYFDGIFANASLFHIPKQQLPKVISNLWATLKPNGILFSSNPRGNNEEGWQDGRFGSYHDLKGWQSFLTNANFIEIEHYYRPSCLPIEQQPWLASVWRKSSIRA